jgi:thymidylate synthase (FAD)
MYVCGNVRSWIHYIQVRTDPSTQLEHREIAEEVRDVFTKQYPAVAAALDLDP